MVYINIDDSSWKKFRSLCCLNGITSGNQLKWLIMDYISEYSFSFNEEGITNEELMEKIRNENKTKKR